jgi:apolipoprotein N-acyltransferase
LPRLLTWSGRLAGWRADLAAGLLGALAAAALPPLYLLPLLLVSVPGLLALLGGAASARIAARRGFWFAFAHNLFGLYWLTEAILVEAADFWWFVPFAVPMTAAVLSVFTAAACAVAWFAPAGWRRVLALAGAWVLSDLARQFVGSGFPWNLWGSVWEFPGPLGAAAVQPAAWIGIHGLTLGTLLLAGLPVLGWRARVAGVIGLAVWLGSGMWRLEQPAGPAPGVTVVLVQGNVPQEDRMTQRRAVEIFRRYLALTAQGVAAAAPGPKVVVWPEAASPFLLEGEPAARAAIAEAANGGRFGATTSLVGSLRFPEGGFSGDPRNSLIAVSGEGGVSAVYDKWHLVPFGEYQPNWLPFLKVIAGGSLSPGPGPRTLALPGLPPVGVLICYEAIFSGQSVQEEPRPDWLVNITNDAWFGNSSGPRQHLAAARMRAVEEGLPLVRAANTGITAAFDAHGREIARLARGEPGVVSVVLPGKLPPTLYSRFGLLIPLILASLVLGTAFSRIRHQVAQKIDRAGQKITIF